MACNNSRIRLIPVYANVTECFKKNGIPIFLNIDYIEWITQETMNIGAKDEPENVLVTKIKAIWHQSENKKTYRYFYSDELPEDISDLINFGLS